MEGDAIVSDVWSSILLSVVVFCVGRCLVSVIASLSVSCFDISPCVYGASAWRVSFVNHGVALHWPIIVFSPFVLLVRQVLWSAMNLSIFSHFMASACWWPPHPPADSALTCYCRDFSFFFSLTGQISALHGFGYAAGAILRCVFSALLRFENIVFLASLMISWCLLLHACTNGVRNDPFVFTIHLPTLCFFEVYSLLSFCFSLVA